MTPSRSVKPVLSVLKLATVYEVQRTDGHSSGTAPGQRRTSFARATLTPRSPPHNAHPHATAHVTTAPASRARVSLSAQRRAGEELRGEDEGTPEAYRALAL